MSVTGEPGGPPVKTGVPLTDLGAGLFALAAILAALHQRHTTGAGQYIDTSLLEAGLALSVWESAEFFAGGVAPQALGSAHRFLAPYQAIRCADGHITIGAGTDRLFADLAAVLGHPEWTRTPEFADTTARLRNRAALIVADRSGDNDAGKDALARSSLPREGFRAAQSTPTRTPSRTLRSNHARWWWTRTTRHSAAAGPSASPSRCLVPHLLPAAALPCSANTRTRSFAKSA